MRSRFTRRELLELGAALAASMGLGHAEAALLAAGAEKIARRQERILWLEGMSCTGCSVSLLNAESPDVLEVITRLVSLVYHGTLSAGQGAQMGAIIDKLVQEGDFIVVLEGAVPMGMPEACSIGGKHLTDLLPDVLRRAKSVVAAGTCSSFGGVPAAEGNETKAASLREFMNQAKIPTENRLLNCPGCPIHPESIVGLLAYLASKGYPKVDEKLLTPEMLFQCSVHDECPKFHDWEKQIFAQKFGDPGCLFKLGCLGPLSHTRCPRRQWNGGVNWCVRAGAPCVSCTSEQFARRRDFPFYRKGEQYHQVKYQEQDRKS